MDDASAKWSWPQSALRASCFDCGVVICMLLSLGFFTLWATSLIVDKAESAFLVKRLLISAKGGVISLHPVDAMHAFVTRAGQTHVHPQHTPGVVSDNEVKLPGFRCRWVEFAAGWKAWMIRLSAIAPALVFSLCAYGLSVRSNSPHAKLSRRLAEIRFPRRKTDWPPPARSALRASVRLVAISLAIAALWGGLLWLVDRRLPEPSVTRLLVALLGFTATLFWVFRRRPHAVLRAASGAFVIATATLTCSILVEHFAGR